MLRGSVWGKVFKLIFYGVWMGRFLTGKEERGEFWVKIEVLVVRKGIWYL